MSGHSAVAPPRRHQTPEQLPLAPPGLQQNIGSSGTPRQNSPENSEQPYEETDIPLLTPDMDADAIEDLSTGLQSQHDRYLTLDVVVDDFWRRLRIGYAHDPAFKTPPSSYRFDKHLQCCIMGHKLVIPDHDDLRKQIL